MTAPRLCFFLVCIVIGTTSGVHAQEPPAMETGAETATPPAQSPSAYESTISEGLLEFQAGRFPEARALFERAFSLFPNARALRGIGMAAFEMRDYPYAWQSLRAALEHPERPLTPEQREDAQLLLGRTTVFLARIELVGLPAGARVLVDGHPPVLDGELMLLGPGVHTITVEADGMRTFAHSIESAGGATQRISVPSTADTPHVPTPAPIERSPVPWVVLGGGAATAIVGVTLGSVGLSHARDPSEDESSARRLGYAGDTLIGIGAAASVAGLVWGLIARRSETSVVVTADVSAGRTILLAGASF